jgi:hypothetical protein
MFVDFVMDLDPDFAPHQDLLMPDCLVAPITIPETIDCARASSRNRSSKQHDSYRV